MKINLHLYWRALDVGLDGGYFCVSEQRIENADDKTYLCSFEVEAPEFDKRALLVEALIAEKQAIIYQATKSAQHIEEKIQQLLALPAGDKNE